MSIYTISYLGVTTGKTFIKNWIFRWANYKIMKRQQVMHMRVVTSESCIPVGAHALVFTPFTTAHKKTLVSKKLLPVPRKPESSTEEASLRAPAVR